MVLLHVPLGRLLPDRNRCQVVSWAFETLPQPYRRLETSSLRPSSETYGRSNSCPRLGGRHRGRQAKRLGALIRLPGAARRYRHYRGGATLGARRRVPSPARGRRRRRRGRPTSSKPAMSREATMSSGQDSFTARANQGYPTSKKDEMHSSNLMYRPSLGRGRAPSICPSPLAGWYPRSRWDQTCM
jgi:hypothetical protein